jgi:prohibitin 1
MSGGIDKTKVYGEGLNWIIPFYQKPYIFDIRKRASSISTKTGTKGFEVLN